MTLSLISSRDKNIIKNYNIEVTYSEEKKVGIFTYNNRQFEVSILNKNINLNSKEYLQVAQKIAVMFIKKDLLNDSDEKLLNANINHKGITNLLDRSFYSHDKDTNTRKDYNALSNYILKNSGKLEDKINDPEEDSSYDLSESYTRLNKNPINVEEAKAEKKNESSIEIDKKDINFDSFTDSNDEDLSLAEKSPALEYTSSYEEDCEEDWESSSSSYSIENQIKEPETSFKESIQEEFTNQSSLARKHPMWDVSTPRNKTESNKKSLEPLTGKDTKEKMINNASSSDESSENSSIDLPEISETSEESLIETSSEENSEQAKLRNLFNECIKTRNENRRLKRGLRKFFQDNKV